MANDIIRTQDPFASALRYAHGLKVPAYIAREGDIVTVTRSDGSGVVRRFGPETHHQMCSRLIATFELVSDALTLDKRGAR